MNLFRLAGDLTHLASFVVLLLKILATRSCRGISLRTQELYTLVFVCRYLDLFTRYISLYNSLMKLVFLASSAAILFLMRGAKGIRQTRDAAHDTFRVAFLVAPAALLALLFSADRRGLMETAWTFSILLEAVAILPQLVLLQRTGNVDNLTGDYVFLLGTYRAFYLVNWFYRWMTEPGYKQWLVWISGTLQTGLYLDFFYYYLRAWRNNEKLSLPS